MLTHPKNINDTDRIILEIPERIIRNIKQIEISVKIRYAFIYSITHFFFFIVGWTN